MNDKDKRLTENQLIALWVHGENNWYDLVSRKDINEERNENRTLIRYDSIATVKNKSSGNKYEYKVRVNTQTFDKGSKRVLGSVNIK